MNLQIFVAENFSKIVYMGSVGDLNTCRGIMLGRGLGCFPWFRCRWGSVCRMGLDNGLVHFVVIVGQVVLF